MSITWWVIIRINRSHPLTHCDSSNCTRIVHQYASFTPSACEHFPINSIRHLQVFKALSKIPSHKFLPLLPQLVSRLGSGTKHFGATLRALVLRVAKDHIYHALLPLFALKNGGQAKQAGGQGSLRTGGSAANSTIDDKKALAEFCSLGNEL